MFLYYFFILNFNISSCKSTDIFNILSLNIYTATSDSLNDNNHIFIYLAFFG